VNSSNVGGTSAYSPPWKFTTIISAPVLLFPAENQQQPASTFLRWGRVAGATGYDIDLSKDSLFSTGVRTTSNLPDTSLAADSLSDETTYYWRVRGKDADGDGGWSEIRRFSVASATFRFELQSGWNLLSIPLEVSDAHKAVLFPSSVSQAFGYSLDSGYTEKDSLTAGAGYWLKFDSAASSVISGTRIEAETLSVRSGWNMVGSIATPVAPATITSIPPGMITGSFFSYAGQYVIADTLRPGKGYWIKISQNGQLILSPATSPLPAGRIRIIASPDRPPGPVRE
jgi:hypothetical protein